MKDTLENFVKECRCYDSDLQIKYKDESKLMKFIGFLLFFNPRFMTDYVTTLGSTIYFPTRSKIENLTDRFVVIHEMIHSLDAKKYTGPIFSLAYLLPQILALPALFLFLLSWKIALPVIIFFLLPLPAYFRMKFEFKAYITELYAFGSYMRYTDPSQKLNQANFEYDRDNMEQEFRGPGYYFMWPFGMKDKFNSALSRIMADNDPVDDPATLTMIDELVTKI